MLLDDKDNEGGHTGREISAGGVIFKNTGEKVEVALISTLRGKRWGLPKGLQEDRETLARTAHREVKEETGLDGRIIEKPSVASSVYCHSQSFANRSKQGAGTQ